MMNINKKPSRLKTVTTGLIASTMAVSAFALSPSSTNIISFPAANAEAVRVEAPQAPSFADVVEAVSPAVVSVRVEQEFQPASDDGGFRFDRRHGRDFDRDDLPRFFRENPDLFEKFFGERDRDNDRFDRRRSERRDDRPRRHRRGMSQGSGFFVSGDGYLVTNNHVIENGSKFTVVMDDGTELDAKLVGADARSDLAVLKVEEARKFTYVSFGETDPRIGEWVVAVGNPFGLGGTVTAGIVSARGREIGANRYDDFIQIDAAVNKGNSGGPAFNLNGEVIGVNTAIFSPSGGNVGIAFAIPAATADEIVNDLISNGKVVRGWLGVQIQPVTQDIADSLGLESGTGAIVTEPQEDSPAAKAGIKSGDVIRSVDGREVKNPRELARVIAGYEPESTVTIGIWRDGEAQDISVDLGTLGGLASASNSDVPVKPAASLGLSLRAAPDGEGVMVMDVRPDSPAAEKGLREGDIVASVNGEKVKNPQEVAKIVAEADKLGRKATLFQIKRDGNSSFVAVPFRKG